MMLLAGCAAQQSYPTATVVKICSGSYLTIKGEDYKVCNRDMLENYTEGSTINVVYKDLDKCTPPKDEYVCLLYHPHKGAIQILEVK